MCTVSFVPNNDGFFFTSNRDESINRLRAEHPAQYRIANRKVYFPKDPQAGGTWFLSDADKISLCLLNGAFEKHTNIPGHIYSKSRGQVVLDVLHFVDFSTFLDAYNFENIEPFTLIAIEGNKPYKLTEFRWDGIKKHILSLDSSRAHVWSSSTLYSDEVKQSRKLHFQKLISESNNLDLKSKIESFHWYEDIENPSNSIIIDRGSLKTISTVMLMHDSSKTQMSYTDLSTSKKNNLLVIHSEPCV